MHSLYLIREKKKSFTLTFISQCQCYRQKGLQVVNFFPLDFLTMVHRTYCCLAHVLIEMENKLA